MRMKYLLTVVLSIFIGLAMWASPAVATDTRIVDYSEAISMPTGGVCTIIPAVLETDSFYLKTENLIEANLDISTDSLAALAGDIARTSPYDVGPSYSENRHLTDKLTNAQTDMRQSTGLFWVAYGDRTCQFEVPI